MAKKLVRQADGTLVETEVAEIPQQGPQTLGGSGAQGGVGPVPAPSVPPLTPAGTAAQGGSPDQAKMTGTPAYKKANAQTETVKSGQDLAQLQRQVGTPTAPAPGATDTARQAQELAGGLSTLGSYGTRIQGLIKARLDEVAQQSTAPTVNKTQVGTVLKGKTPEQIAAAEAALAAYAASGSEADLAKLRDLFGSEALAGGGLETLYEGAAEGLGRVGAAAQAAVTIGDLALPDAPQIAQDLGVTPEQLAAMSPDQFQQAVQDTLNRSLSNVDTLKAEYRTASPARRAQILEELRAADASGLAAAEASAAHLAEELDRGETVKFAGKDYNIQSLLKSDTVSKLIKSAAGNEAALAHLAATEKDLAAWITRNITSLKEFTDKSETQRVALEATQAKVGDLTKDLTPELKEALKISGLEIPEGSLTSEQVAALEASLGSNQVLAAARADEATRAKLQASPELATKLQGMSKEQIVGLIQTSDAIFADPQLTQILGLNAADGVIPPDQLGAAVPAYVAWLQMPPVLRGNPAFTEGLLKGAEGIQFATQYANLLNSSDVQALIEDGSIATAQGLQYVAEHPKVLASLRQVDATQAKVDALVSTPNNPANLAAMQTMLFGAPVDYQLVDRMFGLADDERSEGNVAKGEAQLKTLLATYDLNRDGRFSTADLAPDAVAARLRDTASGLPDKTAILSGAEVPDPFATAQAALNTPAMLELEGQAVKVNEGKAKDATRKAAEVKAAGEAKSIATSLTATTPEYIQHLADTYKTLQYNNTGDKEQAAAMAQVHNSKVNSDESAKVAQSQIDLLKQAISTNPEGAAVYRQSIAALESMIGAYARYKNASAYYDLKYNAGTGWVLIPRNYRG